MNEVQKSKRPRWPLYSAVGCIIIGVGILVAYSQSMNMLLAVPLLISVGLAVFFYSRWYTSEESSVKLTKPVDYETGEINAEVIYAIMDGNKIYPWLIQFEHIPEPLGIPRKFPQLGNKWMSVIINLPKVKESDNEISRFTIKNKDGYYQPLTLPDQRYCSPSLMAEPLNMKHTRDYYRQELSLLQQIKPWIMVAAIFVGGIILLAVE